MNKNIKVLYYNWVPFDNNTGAGGGVSVYIKNIIGEMIKHKEYSVYFLSSGNLYNPLETKPYIEKYKNIYGDKCKSYQIINSPVIAPLGNLAWCIDKYINDNETTTLIKNFIEKHGPFDVIHICNIGGFGQSALTLKKYFPNTKFVFDLHNYNSICMNSYLFNYNEELLCNDNKNGENCLECYSKIKISKDLYKKRVKLYWKTHKLQKILYKLKNNFKDKFENNYKQYYVCNYEKSSSTAKLFEKYRRLNVDNINKYFDNILAVSNRVKYIATQYGINQEKITVSYIGTKFAEHQQKPKNIIEDKNLTIAYLGYANVLKGYYDLIHMLMQLPDKITKRIDVVIAAKNSKKKDYEKLFKKFNSVKVYNGYTHKNLNKILKTVDLGIVPVLWEDNLPQVAIEMVSNGIPILCRNLGGASELSSNKEFCFSDQQEFIQKIIDIEKNRDMLNKYWEGHKPLVTLRENFSQISKIYNVGE